MATRAPAPINAAFARCAAARVAAALHTAGEPALVLEDSAAAELALHLELKLRVLAQLALRLAKRSRRPGILKARDIAEALEVLGSPGPAVKGLRKVAADWTKEDAEEQRPSPLKAFLGKSSSKALQSRIRLSIGSMVEATKESGSDLPLSLAGRPSAAPSQQDRPSPEQQQVLQRLTRVLSSPQSSQEWLRAAVVMCGREELAAIRRFLAQFLAHQVPQRAAVAQAAELEGLFEVLEVLALAAGAERYLHLLMPPLLQLCLAPELGRSVKGPKLLRWRAARLAAGLAQRYRAALPTLHSQLCQVLAEVLRPPKSANPGSVLGVLCCLAALGPAESEQLLRPAASKDKSELQEQLRLVCSEQYFDGLREQGQTAVGSAADQASRTGKRRKELEEQQKAKLARMEVPVALFQALLVISKGSCTQGEVPARSMDDTSVATLEDRFKQTAELHRNMQPLPKLQILPGSQGQSVALEPLSAAQKLLCAMEQRLPDAARASLAEHLFPSGGHLSMTKTMAVSL